MDLYKILGIHRQATDAEIKAAYKSLAQKYHPDKGDTSNEEKFKQIKLAYEILSDWSRRERYDLTGDTDNHDINSKARDIIIAVFLNTIQSPHFNGMTMNVVAKIKNSIESDIRKRKTGISNLKYKKDELEKMISTITYNGSANNILESTINNAIQSINDGLSKEGQMLLELERALELINDYSQSIDEIVSATPVTSTSFFTGL